MWGFLLIVFLLLLALGTLPGLQKRRNWGYYPSAVTALVLLVVLVLMWFGIIAISLPWATPR